MSARVSCPNCGAEYNLRDEHLGKQVRCQKCQQVFGGQGRAGAAVAEAVRPASRPGPVARLQSLPPRGVSRGVLLGSVIGAFLGGALAAGSLVYFFMGGAERKV